MFAQFGDLKSQLSNSVRETLFLITPSLLYPWGLGGVVTKPLGVSLSVMRHYFPEQNRKFDKHFLILFHYYLRGQNDEEKDRSREIFHTKPTRSSSYFSIYGPIDRTGRFYPHTRALRIHNWFTTLYRSLAGSKLELKLIEFLHKWFDENNQF